VNVVEAVARLPIRPILGFRGAKFPKMGDSLPLTPVNRRVKFDAALALSSVEKSVTVYNHTHTKKQLYKHLAYRHVCITNKHIKAAKNPTHASILCVGISDNIYAVLHE